jgi:hypothetical protein
MDKKIIHRLNTIFSLCAMKEQTTLVVSLRMSERMMLQRLLTKKIYQTRAKAIYNLIETTTYAGFYFWGENDGLIHVVSHLIFFTSSSSMMRNFLLYANLPTQISRIKCALNNFLFYSANWMSWTMIWRASHVKIYWVSTSTWFLKCRGGCWAWKSNSVEVNKC